MQKELDEIPVHISEKEARILDDLTQSNKNAKKTQRAIDGDDTVELTKVRLAKQNLQDLEERAFIVNQVDKDRFNRNLLDNYLEGFHIPFIHKDLAKTLDYSKYKSEIYPYCNLQIGIASGGEHSFDLPSDSVDYGKNIAAYYFWVFPNMMFNFYPWGLSLNMVKPINPKLTKVEFRTYVWDSSKLEFGAGSILDKVEREDEDIVEKVQKGVSSRFYKHGRFSPKMEKGVHHFHQLISQFMSKV